MTFKILKDYAQKIVYWSNLHLGYNPLTSNLRIDYTTMSSIIDSRQEDFVDDDTVSITSHFIPDDEGYQDTAFMPII